MIGLRTHAEMRFEKPVYLPRRQPGRARQLPHIAELDAAGVISEGWSDNYLPD